MIMRSNTLVTILAVLGPQRLLKMADRAVLLLNEQLDVIRVWLLIFLDRVHVRLGLLGGCAYCICIHWAELASLCSRWRNLISELDLLPLSVRLRWHGLDLASLRLGLLQAGRDPERGEVVVFFCFLLW